MSLSLAANCGFVGQLELAHQMRPKTVSTPDPLHRTDADPGRFRHRRAGPVAGRRWRSGQASGPQHVRPLRAQRLDARWSRLIAPKPRSTPPLPNRSCQRQITVLALPVACMISAVPRPSAVRRTIFARQTCFCGLLRLITTASSALRSAALNLMFLRSCILQTRTRESGQGMPQRIEMSDLDH